MMALAQRAKDADQQLRSAQQKHDAALAAAAEEHARQLAATQAEHAVVIRQRDAEAAAQASSNEDAVSVLTANLRKQKEAHDAMVRAKQEEWEKALAAHEKQLSASSDDRSS